MSSFIELVAIAVGLEYYYETTSRFRRDRNLAFMSGRLKFTSARVEEPSANSRLVRKHPVSHFVYSHGVAMNPEHNNLRLFSHSIRIASLTHSDRSLDMSGTSLTQ